MKFCRYGVCQLILLLVIHASQSKTVSNEGKVLTVLNVVEESITKAQDLYPNCEDNATASNHSEDDRKETSLKYLEFMKYVVAEAKIQLFPICDKSKSLKLYNKPVDCTEVLANGNTQNGLYSIWPRSRHTNGQSILVYCDMETDGGGWTVIQRRGNFSTQQNFYQDWEKYKTGFGDKKKDFWLGNDYIYALTNQAENEIRFDLQDVNGERGFAQYSTFYIDNEDSSYTLHISNYTGNVGDGMKHYNNMKFSTKDRGDTQYARFYKGGWWYYDWAHVNLNGRYKPDQDVIESNHWWYWRQNRGLAGAEMKVRPR
ncbi:Techylectin-5B like protein [Argiope bruennichi]|uniref:Techylectin-5B like protein n=1 Tax=Argiope bruennichi TaxID=94029 RepID=A0A8T0FFB3_ARGBR|nr:Techylectin-5B like protein [Argiope bruennichi]